MNEKPPFGPGFDLPLNSRGYCMEVWGTEINDPGPDYTEFRLFSGEEMVKTERIAGY